MSGRKIINPSKQVLNILKSNMCLPQGLNSSFNVGEHSDPEAGLAGRYTGSSLIPIILWVYGFAFFLIRRPQLDGGGGVHEGD